MRLKSLEIQGFKSFPDKTRLAFGDGITAVVGPNGSGKSNISDAVRWVLGEQSTKTLRGGKMEDVIFGGTKSRKPQGVAAVSLTVDNAERKLDVNSDEVTISRKLYRSGESEYKVNGNNVRLKDINEMFMDTGLGRDGYSIIGQGRISEIISARSTQRREIFEEAAGISRFRYRKGEAEKQLEMAQENLLRLQDLLSELEGRVEPLREQAEKAASFLKLSEEKKETEISLWMGNLEQLRGQLRAHDDKILAAKTACEKREEEIEDLEQRIGELYIKAQNCAVTVEGLREEIRRSELQEGENKSRTAVLENDILHAQSDIRRVEGEIAEYQLSAQDAIKRVEELNAKIAERERLLEDAKERKLQRESALSAMQEEKKALSVRLDDLSAQKQAALSAQNEAKIHSATSRSLIEEADRRLKSFDESATVLDDNIAGCRREQADCEELLSGVQRRTQELENVLAGCRIKREGREKRRKEHREQAERLEREIAADSQKARLYADMEKNHEGFFNSVRFVLKKAESGRLSGVCGTVADLIQVESRCAQAVETALGSAIQNLVVENEDTAKTAITMLKRENAGRVTLLPLTSIRGKRLEARGLEQCPGFVAVASDVAAHDPKYENIVCFLLGRVVLAEDMDSAVGIAKQFGYQFRVVTLDGQIINTGGSFTGGSAARTVSILSRRGEIEELNRGVQAAKEQLAAHREQEKAAEEESGSLDRQIQETEGELRTAAEDRIRGEGEQKRLALALEDLERQKAQSGSAREELSRHLAELEAKISDSQAVLAGYEKSLTEIDASQAVARTRLDEVTEQAASAAEECGQLRMEVLELTKDLDALRLSREQDTRQREQQEGRLESLESQKKGFLSRIGELKQQIEGIIQENETLKSRILEKNKEIEAATAMRLELEKGVTALREEERQITAGKEEMAREVARLEERRLSFQGDYDRIIASLWDEYQLTRSEAAAFAKPVEDRIRAQGRLAELKNKIRSLGSVNLSAIEEYKEVSGRYAFLKAQMEDVEKSRDELRRLISQLTVRMRETFETNFHLINQNFSGIFMELFGGGTGYLKLTGDDDVLEAGVEIFVEPPGKIIKNLGLLSGGEQAFVAIAIYFAILKVRPSPFCILDEIEAALDDVNVSRYAQYLRKLCAGTQFITITHRRGTMEEADVLYGVTMQEEGVSKLLELNVTEVESKVLKTKA